MSIEPQEDLGSKNPRSVPAPPPSREAYLVKSAHPKGLLAADDPYWVEKRCRRLPHYFYYRLPDYFYLDEPSAVRVVVAESSHGTRSEDRAQIEDGDEAHIEDGEVAHKI